MAERPLEAIVIDPKLVYTRMATDLGGTVVALSEEPAHAINGMGLAPPRRGADRPHAQCRPGGITRTLGFVALACATEGEPLRATERVLAMRCAERAYADRGIRVGLPPMWDVARADTPILTEPPPAPHGASGAGGASGGPPRRLRGRSPRRPRSGADAAGGDDRDV